jgi:hypothetical protein
MNGPVNCRECGNWIRGVLFAGLLLGATAGQFTLAAWACADNPVRDEQRELHVVGVHVGVEKTGNQIHGGRAVVTVNRPKKKVTLALVAYNSITWEVKADTDTTVEKVILGGYHRQAVKGLAPDTDVVHAYNEEGSRSLTYARSIESGQFRAVVQQLARLSNLEIASFYGTYEYRHEAPIIVDQVQADERLLRSYPRPAPPDQLPQLTFRALRYVPREAAEPRGGATYGEFTLAGPKEGTFAGLPRGMQRLVFDPAGNRHFGLAGGLVEIDLAKQSSSKIVPGMDFPRLSYTDLTWDVGRGRILIAGSHLSAYAPATKEWSVLADDPQVTAIAWHPGHDRLYGLAVAHGEEDGEPHLFEFNAHGALIGQRSLRKAIVPGVLGQRSFDAAGIQLIAADDYLVLLISPQAMRLEDSAPKTEYLYLIEPKSGKVQLAWKQEPT